MALAGRRAGAERHADLDRVRAGAFTYDLAIETPSGGAKVAIAVVDQVARTHGIVRLDVPLVATER